MLGGYGSVGDACVHELHQTTSLGLVIAGRNSQRAERAALALGDRARGVYADAADPRTLGSVIPNADAVLCCAGTGAGAALRAAIEHRVPFVDLAPLLLGSRALNTLREEAWSAQVPVVLYAGAVPGLPAVTADFLLRCFRTIHRLEIASCGSWTEGRTAREDLAALRLRGPSPRKLRAGAQQWVTRSRLPDPIGRVWLRPVSTVDLAELEATHCVDQLRYHEPHPGRIAGWLSRSPTAGFCLVADAFVEAGDTVPSGRITIEAPNALAAAAAVAGAVVRAVLRGRVPAGLVGPHEALNPALLLQVIEKRGVRVATESRPPRAASREASASPGLAP